MEILSIVVGLLLIVAVLVFAISRRKARVAARKEQVKEIEHLLDRVSEAATRRKTQLYESMEGSENAALSALKEISADAPVDISEEVEQIEVRWARLSEQLVEFSQQSVQSTLQSSVVTTRAAITADDISQIAEATKAKLANLR